MTIKALVADDEPHGRIALREHLESDPEFEVAVECNNGDDALAAIESGSIDVAFLDVHMPGKSGLDVARGFEAEPAPLFVFVTAFDEHAVEAFEHFAVDYVLKPIGAERFAKTLTRVKRRLAERLAHPSWDAIAAAIDAHATREDRVVIETAGRTVYLDGDQITWAESSGNYARVHTTGGADYTLRITLQQLERQLAAVDVIRVHRAHLVSMRQVRELRSSDGGNSTSLRLSDGTEVSVGRTFRSLVVARLRDSGQA